jgi:hypothetical protein
MWNSRKAGAAILVLAWLLFPASAWGEDEEGCLICHRLGMRRASLEGGEELRVSDPRGGPHESLYCSDCHPDAKAAPHPVSPGAASCIGECHSSSQAAVETHRAASFGGINEGHRGISAPRAPCRLCHRAEDRLANRDAVMDRCSGCHARERDSVSRGVHARIRGQSGDGMCAGCHLAHKTPVKSRMIPTGKANCGGKECHARVTDGMMKLGGHDDGPETGRTSGKAAGAGIFLALAGLGAVSSRFLCGHGRGRADHE